MASALLLICLSYADPSDPSHEHVLARGAARLQFDRLLNSLVETGSVSLQSMEVVNKVIAANSGADGPAAAPGLPPGFLRAYVLGIIENTRGMSNASLRHRFVRLVCIFLNSIVRHADAPPSPDRVAAAPPTHVARALSSAFGAGADEVLEEVVGFCIEHSRIKEAAELFRALKSR